MAVTADKVVVELEARLDKYTASVKGAERQFGRSMANINGYMTLNEKQLANLGDEYEKLGGQIGDNLKKASRAAQIAFAAIAAYSIKLAADASEIESAFDVAFGNSSKRAREFSDVLATKVGRDAVELRENMTQLQLVLTGTGVAAAQAQPLVEALARAGIDAGSLFNTSDAEALQKIISGLTGEAEPLKAFGVVLTETATKAELMRLGFKGNAEGASEAAKSIARANLILQGLAVAQGDAERTAGSAANKTRALTAEFNKAARELGEQLLPAFVKAAGAATDLLKTFNDLPGGVQVAGLAFLGLIAAGGPIAGLIANLIRVIELAKASRAALIAAGAAGGVSGAGSAAGGAGLLAGAGAATGGVGLIAGGVGIVLAKQRAYDKTLDDLSKATYAQLASAKKAAEVNMMGLKAVDGGRALGRGGAADRNLAILTRQLGAIDEQIVDRAKKTADATSAAVKGGLVGGFSLPDSLKTGAAGKPSASGRRGPAAKPPAYDIRAALERGERIPESQRRISEVDPIENQPLDFREQMDFSDFVSSEEIQRGMQQLKEQLQRESEDGLYQGIRGGLEAAADGNLLQFLQHKLRDAALNGLAEGITQALAQAAGQSSTVKSVLGFLGFGGVGFGRAAGGHVVGGQAYPVNEKGHLEGFVAPQSGRIVPLGNVKAAQGGGTTVLQTLVFNAQGAVMTGELLAQANTFAAGAAQQAASKALSVANRGAPGRLQRFQALGS